LQPITPIDIETLTPPLKVTFIQSLEELASLQDFFARVQANDKGVLGWDVETTPLKDYFFRRCRTVQFGNNVEQYVIDLLPFCDNDPNLLFSCQGQYGANLPPKLKELMLILEPVLCSRNFLKVGVNLGFEYMTFYWNFGLRTYNYYDCSMAEKCIWAGAHSMKDYGYYSMNEMMERYFRKTVDKQYQESFTLDAVLEPGQIKYAALDTRFPLNIMMAQKVVASGIRLKTLKEKGSPMAKFMENLEPKNSSNEPIVMGDNLNEIVQIENDAIGMFEDMHIHGERMDKEKWRKRIDGKIAELTALYSDSLDPYFIPLVGSKYDINTDAEIDAKEAQWKAFNVVSPAELELKKQIAVYKKAGDTAAMAHLEMQKALLEQQRKDLKETLKTEHSDMKKKRTKIKNLAAKCEGAALINYSSDSQLLAALQEIKGLKSMKKCDDDTLAKYEAKGFAICGSIRKLHTLSKEIGTYGYQWATEWTSKPCKEEGWLHPGDGRLHCVYNQYDAETGRSSSEKPNGQNLPQDEAVRSCFIADPPNESIRVSDCCNADAPPREGIYVADFSVPGFRCSACGELCNTHAEEYVIITADMSGAELRIIAELAQDPVWIGAFGRGEDVHSVGTEILHEQGWVVLTEPGCKYYAKKENGEPARQKCKCKGHAELRNENKSTNFLLAYGGGPSKLAQSIGKTVEKAAELMELHSKKFPRIWAYLEQSGKNAYMKKRSFDMYGRRRLFPDPTWDRAKEKAKVDNEEKLRLSPEEAQLKYDLFVKNNNRKPDKEELWFIEHNQPTQKEIGKAMGAMSGSIERQGKNHAIQGTNATIIKLAGGCGFDKDGVPYLWHTLPTFRARLIKMVHDELVVQCPKHKATEVAKLIGDAFKRAAAVKMTAVVMEFDSNIAECWKK